MPEWGDEIGREYANMVSLYYRNLLGVTVEAATGDEKAS
jgi:hypothetical protein